ncbi:MAG: hypothetical protein ACI4SX_01185 [Candidatus Fimenecus sp.]
MCIGKTDKFEPDFKGEISGSALLKYSEIRQDFLRFCAAHNQKSRTLKFCDRKGAEFGAIFGAAHAARLTPCKGNKPKSARITPSAAGSNLSVWPIPIFA